MTPLVHEAAAARLRSDPDAGRLRDRTRSREVLALRAELAGPRRLRPDRPARAARSRHGALNLHPSLLPRHRGATPIPAAILAGDAETGVTLMRMDAGLDTGPIVAQAASRSTATRRRPLLEEALEVGAADLLERASGPWLRGESAPAATRGWRDADPAAPSRGRPARPDAPGGELERQVRAYQPWPGSFVETALGRLIVWARGAGRRRARTPAGRFDEDGSRRADGPARLRRGPAGRRQADVVGGVRPGPAVDRRQHRVRPR